MPENPTRSVRRSFRPQADAVRGRTRPGATAVTSTPDLVALLVRGGVVERYAAGFLLGEQRNVGEVARVRRR
jgi:hypothetical protein